MAQVDYYLMIPSLPGESRDARLSKGIELLSWSWSEYNNGSAAFGSGAGVGKVEMDDFRFKMKASNVSPIIVKWCASGQVIGEATLICRKAGGEDPVEYLRITFKNLVISQFHTQGGSGDETLPIDSISFNYSEMVYKYTEQQDTGMAGSNRVAGWDLKGNKAIAA